MIKPNTPYPVSRTQYFEKQRQNQDTISVRWGFETRTLMTHIVGKRNIKLAASLVECNILLVC